MPVLPPSPPLPVQTDFLSAILLGGGMSVAAFVLIVAYTVNAVSKETNQSPVLVLGRLTSQVSSNVARARERWVLGQVRSSWQAEKAGLRLPLALVLLVELFLISSSVLVLATSRSLWAGPGLGVFGGTVLLSTCILFNGVLLLLWMAGPHPDEPAFAYRLRQLFQPKDRTPGLSAATGPEPLILVLPVRVLPQGSARVGLLPGLLLGPTRENNAQTSASDVTPPSA